MEEDYKIKQRETLRIIGLKKGTWKMAMIAQAKRTAWFTELEQDIGIANVRLLDT